MDDLLIVLYYTGNFNNVTCCDKLDSTTKELRDRNVMDMILYCFSEITVNKIRVKFMIVARDYFVISLAKALNYKSNLIWTLN